MPNIEVLTRVKKETMAEVHRYGEEQKLHHFYWRLGDPENACVDCKRRDGRLVNVYEIKYTLDTEFCRAQSEQVCPFTIEATSVMTVVDERARQLAELDRLEGQGVRGIRWQTADVEGLADRCIKRDGRVFTLDQARRELSGDFCKFADPKRGCECLFEEVSEDLVKQVEPPPAPDPKPVNKSGCGATILLFCFLSLSLTLALF